MARRFLYHITPTRNLPSILQNGLEPHAGGYGDYEWSERVWLCTNLDAILREGLIMQAFRPRKDENHPFDDPLAAGWPDGWPLDPPIDLSIVVVDRSMVKTHANDAPLAAQMRLVTDSRMHEASVWTANPIPPSALIGKPYQFDPQARQKPGLIQAILDRQKIIVGEEPPKEKPVKKPGKRINAIARTLMTTPKG
jgi:hypothetical protein